MLYNIVLTKSGGCKFYIKVCRYLEYISFKDRDKITIAIALIYVTHCNLDLKLQLKEET